jgi:hypothetical protein
VRVLNRILLIVNYKQEFLDFLDVRDEDCNVDLTLLNDEPGFYLIREPTSNEDYSKIIKDNIQNIFSTVYEGFSENQYTVSEKEFESFFDIGCNEMVRDLSDSDYALGYENF